MTKRHKSLEQNNVERFAWVFLSVMCVMFLFPLVVAVMISISSFDSVKMNGYQLIPSEFSLEAYRILINDYGKALLRSIVLTVGTGLIQPLLSIVLTVMMAYPLSQSDFVGSKFWRRYVLITMLFSGGIVSSYVLHARYLGLRDNVLIYLLPALGGWNIFLFRTFFAGIDKSMVESAKIDGANNTQILLKIMLPLTKPLIAINFFSGFLARWNDITTPLYYISKRELFTVQYLLQELLRSAESLKLMMESGLAVSYTETPIESIRFALAVVGALPVFLLFPYMQKYYAKGVTLGSTKG